eukprot:504503-Rhodomonas_salina.1
MVLPGGRERVRANQRRHVPGHVLPKSNQSGSSAVLCVPGMPLIWRGPLLPRSVLRWAYGLLLSGTEIGYGGVQSREASVLRWGVVMRSRWM